MNEKNQNLVEWNETTFSPHILIFDFTDLLVLVELGRITRIDKKSSRGKLAVAYP
jgi:hypothetical protein